MTSRRLWSRTSTRLTLLLLAVVVPPAATLVWLGAQLLQQDRAVLERREVERRTAVGEAVASELLRLVAAAERGLEDGTAPDGVARFVLRSDGLDVTPPGRMLWTPAPHHLPQADEHVFASATAREDQGDLSGALLAYRELARSPDPAIRASALRRIARVHRRQNHLAGALETYHTLAALRGVADLGMPADLLARRNICDVLHASGRSAELQREAERLEKDLLASTWSLDDDAWDLTMIDLERWRGTAVAVPEERKLFTVAADRLWREFTEGSRLVGQEQSRLLEIAGTPITVFSDSSGSQASLIVATPDALQAWSSQAVTGAIADQARLALLTPSGTILAGTPAPAGTPVVSIKGTDSGLPWTLVLHSHKWARAGEEFAYRRRLLTPRRRIT